MGARGPRKTSHRFGAPPASSMPTGEAGRPPKPAHVKEDKVASKAFDDAADALERLGILRRSHEMPLALFAVEWSRHVYAARIAREAPIVDGPRGSKANPAAGVASQAARVALDLLRDFGLTPAALARVDVPPAPDPELTALDEFILRRPDTRARRGLT